jgi:hypothetical protein
MKTRDTRLGARSGWGGPDAAIVYAGEFAGEAGASALGNLSWWRAEPGSSLDVAGFVSADIASLWLACAFSAASFVSVEPMLRWLSSTSQWAFAPALESGIRAAGGELRARRPAVNRTRGPSERALEARQ